MENGLFDDLPHNLSSKLITHVYYREIHQIDVYRGLDIGFTAQLVVNSRPYQAVMGDIIYDTGDIAEDMSFLLRGTVSILMHNKGEKVTLLGSSTTNGFFGDFEFNYGSKNCMRSLRQARYQVVQDCTLYSVDFLKLKECIDHNFECGQKFLEILKVRYDNFRTVVAHPLPETVDNNAVTNTKPYAKSSKIDISSGSGILTTMYSQFQLYGWYLRNMISSKRNKKSKKMKKKPQSFLIVGSKKMSQLFGHSSRISGSSGKSDIDKSESGGGGMKTNNLVEKEKIFGLFLVDGEKLLRNNMRARLAMEPAVQFTSHSSSLSAKLLSLKDRPPYYDQQSEKFPVIEIETKNGVAAKPVDRTMDFFNKRGIFHPNNRFKVAWDTTLGLLILYTLIYVPLDLAFQQVSITNTTFNNDYFYYAIDFMFLIDIFIHCNTSYISDIEDAYVVSREKIFLNYCKSLWFPIDVIACIPFPLIITYAISATQENNHDNTKIIQLTKILRVLRFAKLYKLNNLVLIQNKVEDFLNMHRAWFNLLVTLIQVLLVSHLISCMWWGLCTRLSSTTWYDEASMVFVPLRNAALRDQYIAALYWTVTTLTSTGYGDIVPSTNNERIVNIVIMVIGATVFGYIVANISKLLEDFNKNNNRWSIRIGSLNEYLESKHCPYSLSCQILDHYRQSMRMNSFQNSEAVLNRLPFHIRTKIQMAENRFKFDHIPFFRYIHNDSVKMYLLNVLTPRFAEKGIRIVTQLDIASEIVFLTSGKALICRMTPDVRNSNKDNKNTTVIDMLRKQSSVLSDKNKPIINLLRQRNSLSERNKSKKRTSGLDSMKKQPSLLDLSRYKIPGFSPMSKGRTTAGYFKDDGNEILTAKQLRAQYLWKLVRTNRSKIIEMASGS